MRFDLGTASFSADSELFGPDASTAGFGEHLEAGANVALELTTQSGGTTTERLVVPKSLSGTDAVSL